MAAAQPLLVKFRIRHIRLLPDGLFRGQGFPFLRQAAGKPPGRRQSCPAQGGPAELARLPLLLLHLLSPLGGLLLHDGRHGAIHHVLQGHQPLPWGGALFGVRHRGFRLRRLRDRLGAGRTDGLLRRGCRLLCRRLLRGGRYRRRTGAELRQNVLQRKFLRHGYAPNQLRRIRQSPVQFFLRVFAHSPRFTSGGAPPHITILPRQPTHSGTRYAPSWECSPESRTFPAPDGPCRCPPSR